MKVRACSTCTDVCCKRTTYKLLNSDIQRILTIVHPSLLELATIHNEDGTIQLKAPCPFLDDRNQCSIYLHRPLGCRISPVVWNHEVTTDPSCPGHTEVLHPERYTIELHHYLFLLEQERKERLDRG